MPPQIKQAKLETLEAIIKEVEEQIDMALLYLRDDSVDMRKSAERTLSDLLTKLQAQKELIENSK